MDRCPPDAPPPGSPPPGDPSLRPTLQLAMLPGVGPRRLAALLERFGDAASVLQAPGPELAAVRDVGPKLIHTIRTASHHVDVESVQRWCVEQGVVIAPRGDETYPRALESLVDAPLLVFLRGRVLGADEVAVAIVGTRHATGYGLRQAERLAYGLARAGVTVVSGLARGIDSAAHRGALDAGGRTLAVLGSGLGQIYPPEHEALAGDIAARGAVISEYAPHARPRGGMFPQRNRLISGLSLAVLVIEAPDRSGSLITARLAGEQGREVLALPGPVTSRASRGCNRLIRDGATLVQTVDDVLEALGPTHRPLGTGDGHEVRNGIDLTLNERERRVLACVEPSSTPIDQVIATSQLPAHRVVAIISVLEMKKLVRRLSAQYVARI